MTEQRKIWEDAWSAGVTRNIRVEKPVTEYLRAAAQAHPDHVALNYFGHEVGYRSLNRLADRFARGLIALGLQTGDRVALFLPNCPQYVVAFFGVLRAGGVVVALNTMFKTAELNHEIHDADIEILVCIDSLFPEIDKIRSTSPLKHIIIASLSDYADEKAILPLPPEALAEKQDFAGTIDYHDLLNRGGDDPICRVTDVRTDLALLQYTSGTTGKAKGAMISHHGLALACLGAVNWHGNDARDVFLGVAPFFHIMGMVQSMCVPLVAGATLVVLARFSPQTVAEAIHRFKCTAWVGTTTMLIALLQLEGIEKYDMTHFRYVVSGGAPISVALQERFAKLVPNAHIIEGYGLTECISQGGALTPLGGYRPGYVGVPFLNDLKIVDPDRGGVEVGFDTQGEIILKGECLMTGYWRNPEETAKVMRDGWLYTGDVGAMDARGYMKLSGRRKELIKCSGFSVFPAEVENIIYQHPAVEEVVVVGVPDPYRGESPKAYMVVKPAFRNQVSEDEIVAWCKDVMATYKRPREVVFVDALPKNAAGKILRRKLVN